jgi:hypothetical protein
MVKALGDILVAFPGESSRTRCFSHIINLIAKSILKQFDINKAQKGETVDEALQELIEDLDQEVLEKTEEEGSGGDDDDNTDGWVDEREEMSETECKELDEDVQPVRQVLVKASSMFFGVLFGIGCVDADKALL